MNIYVGNLAWKTKRKELKELFENFGEVSNAFIVRDKKTRRSRGFGFVEMTEDDEARVAIEKLNNTVFLERTIIVNEALPKEENGDHDSSDDFDDDYDDDSTDDQEGSTDHDGSGNEDVQETTISESSGSDFDEKKDKQ